MKFLTVNDFIGEVNLDLNNDPNVLAQFNALGTQVETDILRDLLGDKLYTDFSNDLSTSYVPQTQKYIDLLNGVAYITDCEETIIYDGFKRMLKYFIYSYYLNNSWAYNTSIGQMNGVNENATLLNRSDLRKVSKERYNEAVVLYNKAVLFIDTKHLDYFANNDYTFWYPKRKTFIGEIITLSPANNYFYNRSSKGN